MNALSKTEQLVFWSYHEHRRSVTQTATALGMTALAVRNTLAAANRKLDAQLADLRVVVSEPCAA